MRRLRLRHSQTHEGARLHRGRDHDGARAAEALEQEVKTYDQYLTNETYCASVFVGGVEDTDVGGGDYYGGDHVESGLLHDAFEDGDRATRAKRVPDLGEALARSRAAFEVAPHPTLVRLPDHARPGAFAEYPFPRVADARAFLAAWFPDRDRQDDFIEVER